MDLLRKEITDEYSQENFRRIQQDYNSLPFVKMQAKFFEVTFGSTTSTYPLTTTFTHGLGFLPKDVLPTSVIGGTVTWGYGSFTATTISVTVSAMTTVRFFLGRYAEGNL